MRAQTKTRYNVKSLCTAGLLLAMGVILPSIFHGAGGQQAGQIFLPMHLCVFLGAALLGPVYGIYLGVLTPLVSHLIMGVPLIAFMPFMIIELVVYGALTGLLHRRINIYPTLIIAQIAGRLVLFLSLFTAFNALGFTPFPGAYTLNAAWGGVVTGLPGIAIQLLLIPPCVVLIRKFLKD